MGVFRFVFPVAIILYGWCGAIDSSQADLRLSQVLQAYPEIGKFQSSQEDTFHFGQPLQFKIKDSSYRVRFFMFQSVSSESPVQNVAFGTWAQAQGLLASYCQKEQRAFGTLLYFKSRKELEDDGVYYTLSLAPEGDAVSEVTLGEVLAACPELAQFNASSFLFAVKDGEAIRKVGKEKYELRYFTFFVSPEFEQNSKIAHAPFAKICQDHKLAQTVSQTKNSGYGDLEVFTQSEEMKNKGIYYTLSLRKVD